jgi:hypothetical protein
LQNTESDNAFINGATWPFVLRKKKIVFENRALRRMFGTKMGELIGE